MRKSITILICIIVLTIVSFIGVFYLKNNHLNDKNLINITELDQKFMDNYFEKAEKINKSDNKENILIITSSESIDDDYGATDVIEAPNNQYILQYDTKEEKDKALEKFNKNEEIVSVEENIIYKPLGTFNSWGIEKIGLDYGSQIVNAKELGQITVAIIDTGCDMTLFNNSYPGKITETYNVLNTETEMTDVYHHGTHIAGTIAEGTPDNVKIIPIKVGNDNGAIRNSDVITAINYIVYNHKADVINMSFGSYVSSDGMRLALEAANSANIICVAAAGNDNTAAPLYPASFDTTISVAAVDSDLVKTDFSNYGPTITFAAPGKDIVSLTGNYSGTSMASPHVVSAVAILKSIYHDYTKDEIIESLKKYAIDLGTKGHDNYYGYGFINFLSVPFCTSESVNCDEHEVFEEDVVLPTTKIEIPTATLTTYNYGSITNLLINTQAKIYTDEETYTTKYLWELDELELLNYDPFSTSLQTITANYGSLTTTFTLTQTEEYVSLTNLGWTYSTNESNEISLNSFIGGASISHIVIPSLIDGKSVTTLGEKLFYEANIETAILPLSVDNIGKQAFMGTNLERITISSPTVKVGEEAFANLSSLETIDSSIASLGNSAFINCVTLDNITLDSTLLSIGTSAFSGCFNLTNITIPSGVTSIGASAFKNTKIKTANVPSGVTVIYEDTFSGCNNIATITLSNSLTTIKSNAFNGTNIKALNIPKNVSSIGACAFCNSASLTDITVDSENTTYDSRNSNSIIETATNKMLLGSGKTVVPNTVRIIGENAFANVVNIVGITIPEGVVEIQNRAFYNCLNLQKISLPRSLTTIGTNAFGSMPDLVVWLFSDSYAKTYAIANNLRWCCFDPQTVNVSMKRNSYKAFETVDTENLKILLHYEDGFDETITTGYVISYTGTNTSFRYGDTYFKINARTEDNYEFNANVPVTVSKATPTYVVPTGLTAYAGQTLSEITLPTGFAWMDGTTLISEGGDVAYKAKFIPEDSVNYEIVNDIDIVLTVTFNRTEVIPNISISTKIYDGTNTIDPSTITVSNLDSSLYTIESATSTASIVGNTTASIKIKLTNTAYLTKTFASNKQEETFTANLTITYAKIPKPTKTIKTYTYNGESQEIELINYVDSIMEISNNARINAGDQDVTISLTDTNYLWNDDSNDNVIIPFHIDKANGNYVYNAYNTNIHYDGNEHSIPLELTGPSNAKVKYMDSTGNYTLDTMPKYKNVGVYIIKFKIYIDSNYNELLEERTLTIDEEEIINNSTDYSGIYDGNSHSFNLDINIANYTIRYSINDLTYNLTEMPTFKDVGEYIVNYQISGNGFTTILASNKVIIYGISEIDDTMELKNDVLLVKNQNYNFNNISSGITTKSTSCTFTHYDKNKVLLNDPSTRTGDIIYIYLNNTKKLEYTISLLGDINSDGKVSSGDYVKVRKHIMQSELIIGNAYFYAADVNRDGKITSSDYVKIKKFIMNGEGL